MNRPVILTEQDFLSHPQLNDMSAAEAFNFYCKELAKERQMLLKVQAERDALSMQHLQFLYLRGELKDPDSFDFVEERMRQGMETELRASTIPNNRYTKKAQRLKTGPKPRGDERIALRVAMNEMLSEQHAIEALTTVWKGCDVGKGMKGERVTRDKWPSTFAKIEEQLAGYVGNMFKGSSHGVCVVYARMSFGSTPWYPYEDPRMPIAYPEHWGR